MAFKVLVGETAWAGFLRRAKAAYPKEYIEAIWGVETIDAYRITDFKRIKVNRCTTRSIEYDEIELKRQVHLAKKENKTYLGTVHTHPSPNFDSAGSRIDHHDSMKEEKLMGIMVIYKKKDSNRFVTETDWWFPQRKIEFELLPE